MIVRTQRDEFRSRFLVTCSGLMADRVVSMLGLRTEFVICPFRGDTTCCPSSTTRSSTI